MRTTTSGACRSLAYCRRSKHLLASRLRSVARSWWRYARVDHERDEEPTTSEVGNARADTPERSTRSRRPRVGPVTPLGSDLATELKKAFYDHVVLLFRGQGLDAAQQIAFTEHFGKVEPHPLRTRRSVEGYPDVLILENQPGKPGARNDYWHSDISHAERPPLATLQRRASACSVDCP